MIPTVPDAEVPWASGAPEAGVLLYPLARGIAVPREEGLRAAVDGVPDLRFQEDPEVVLLLML